MSLQPVPTPDAAPVAAGLDDPPRGCGWFDSSHDLRAGLSVIEHRSADEVARLVPLGWWLDWQLGGSAANAPRHIEAGRPAG